MKRKLSIFILMILVLLITGCQEEIHTKEDLIKYVEKQYYPFDNLKIKNNYKVVEEVNDQKNGKDRLLLNLKLDNYDLDFYVESSYDCVLSLDGSCANYYEIKSNYITVVKTYLNDIFEKNNSLPICKISTSNSTAYCYLTKLEQVDDIATYIERYISFVEEYKISNKFINAITIEVPTSEEKGYTNQKDLTIKKENDKYYLAQKDTLYKTKQEVKDLLTSLIN